MPHINRRDFIALTAGATAVATAGKGAGAAQPVRATGLVACLHGASSGEADFRTSMEGWARGGIKATEPELVKARDFEQANGKGSARRLMDDLGLKAWSCSNQLNLEESGPLRAQAIEDLKWKLEMAESLGANRMVAPSAASQPHVLADYEQVHANLREAAELAKPHGVVLMLEFTRNSRLVSNVRTSLEVVRAVDHPNIRFMIDLFHFWAGTSKFEDLDLVRPGEVHHVHFVDRPAQPPVELLEQKDRAFPGEGITPMQKILDKLVALGYDRALSLELFDPQVRRADPAITAARTLKAINPFIEQASCCVGGRTVPA